MVRFLPWIIIAVLSGVLIYKFLPSLTPPISPTPPTTQPSQTASPSASIKTHHVFDIVDGDTYAIEDKILIRMFSVDSPELTQCGGSEAKEALEKLILGKDVTLDTRIRDTYGRLTATTFIGNRFIDKEMIEGGYTRYYPHNYERKQELIEAGQKARDAKLGIWSEKCTQLVNKQKPKCTIKGNYNPSTKLKLYEFPACNDYTRMIVQLHQGDEWFCSEKEAQDAGFQKSKNCHNEIFTTR